MWISLITILCASGTVLGYNQPQSVLAHGPINNRTRSERPNRIVRRFTCPDGFVRLKRNCFYFSGGIATWQDAHFFCKDRNATLATLPKKHMDRQLRDYLSGPQMQQLERWIGARYNWGKKSWEWGVTGEEMTYDGFSKLRSGSDQLYRWHCAIMNPERKFRWAARSCIERKYYICHTPAAKLGKVRRKGQPGGPRRQRIRSGPRNNGTKSRQINERNHKTVPYSQGPARSTRKSRPMWGNGMKLGMRPPALSTRWAPGAKYSDRLQLVKGKSPLEPDQWVGRSKIAEMSENRLDSEPSKKPSEEIPGVPAETGPKSLSGGTNSFVGHLGGQLGNFFNEEILLKN